MPGFCPAMARKFDPTWFGAELKRPQWFKDWSDWYTGFESWSISQRSIQLEKWHPDFLDGWHTHELSKAYQKAGHATSPSSR